MATKSYSKHKEYKEFKSSGNVPYTGEQFDMIKSDLMPKSKLPEGVGNGHREYHYEYKEQKHPSGKYDRKDLRTVEQFSIPPKTKPGTTESSQYYYERAERELPAINQSTRSYNYESNIGSSPGYSRVKSSKATKDKSHNAEELDSLLDDLQKDQERQLYKSGYTSDTAESTSFDYRRGTPTKAPSSGYSTLKKEERLESSSWGVSPPPVTRATELRQEMFKEEKIGGYTSDTAESTYGYNRGTVAKAPSSGYSTLKKEERLESSSWGAPHPPPVTTRATELRQEMYKEEKTESRVVPSQISPAIAHPVPAVLCSNCHPPTTGTLSRSGTPMNKVTTTVKTYTYEVPADQDPTTIPIPTHTTETYLSSADRSTSTTTHLVPPSPSLGCQYCSHCNTRVTRSTTAAPAPPVTTTVKNYHLSSSDVRDDRVVYPQPVQEIKLHPENGHGPYGPTTYKYSETTYSSQNTTERLPLPAGPFPRAPSPAPPTQQPPKALDDLLADFPEARFPTETDGMVRQRKVEVSHEKLKEAPKPPSSRNVAGPPVYYPPGHTPFQPKEGYEASASMQAGGAYASGKGMYEYEAGSKSKEKRTEKKTAVPVCLPMCCAMPCVIM